MSKKLGTPTNGQGNSRIRMVLGEDHKNLSHTNPIRFCGFSRNPKTTEHGLSFSPKHLRRQQVNFLLSNIAKKTWRMATKAPLHGLIIFDKEVTNLKEAAQPSPHHPPPHHSPQDHIYSRSPLFCSSSWSPSLTGLTTSLASECLMYHCIVSSILYSNCSPAKLVDAGHGNLPLVALLTGLPQLSGQYKDLCSSCKQIVFSTGGRCLQSHEGSPQQVLLKSLQQLLLLLKADSLFKNPLMLPGLSLSKSFIARGSGDPPPVG